VRLVREVAGDRYDRLELNARRERWGISYYSIVELLYVDASAPVVARLAGR
jgi:hypothetical protein